MKPFRDSHLSGRIFPRVDEDGFPYPDSEYLDYIEFFDCLLNMPDDWFNMNDGGVDDDL